MPILAAIELLHGPEFTVVLIICLALVAGAITRLLTARIRLPFTVVMLLVGIAMGSAIKALYGVYGEEDHHALATIYHHLEHGSGVSHNLIIFVFLPALVFESAFSMEVHAFGRAIGAIAVLAVPALIAATFMTAGMMQGIVPESWGWTLTHALIFGTLISATDPVAVVALMRELGVSKKLATLIEGESLLNDGTAIVIFTVLLGMLQESALKGGEAEFTLGPVVLQFLVVVAGGVAVGLLLSMLISWVIGRTFNDPMVEITLTIVLCYAAMIIAEGLLHVSGVMAIVVSGLWMSGPGKTKISPAVGHFLHEFWEMVAYIANTLVFFLVGLVMGGQVGHATGTDLLVILGCWVGIVVIRTIVTFVFRPVANTLIPEKMSTPDSIVAVWGGLRGAVSMALALIVSQSEFVPEIVREKLLLVTAGVVLMTLLVNGTTMGMLLRHFGYDKAPVSGQLAHLAARLSALGDVEKKVGELRGSRELRTVSWKRVDEDLTQRTSTYRSEAEALREELVNASPEEQASGYWRQILRIERGAYWHAFEQGTLGSAAVKALDHEIDLQLDRAKEGNYAPPKERHPHLGPFQAWMRRTIRTKSWYAHNFATAEFEQLAKLYDLSRGEAYAAGVVLENLENLSAMDGDVRSHAETTYRRYLRAGKARLEEMRLNLPELTEAIESRIAETIALGYEKQRYDALGHHGAVDKGTAHKLTHEVDERLHDLMQAPRLLPLPDVKDLIRAVPLFAPLSNAAIDALADASIRIVVPEAEFVFQQGDKGDALYVVARGAAEVIASIEGEEHVLDVVGGGDIVGEMALLTGEPRNAGVCAATSVTVIKIPREAFQTLMSKSKDIQNEVWDAFAQRSADNYLRRHRDYAHLNRAQRCDWAAGRPHMTLDKDQSYGLGGDYDTAFVLVGAVCDSEKRRYPAPSIVSVPAGGDERLDATTDTRVVLIRSETAPRASPVDELQALATRPTF